MNNDRISGYLNEYEEIILTDKIKNISKYTKKFIILKDKVEQMKETDWFTDNMKNNLPFILNKYITKIKDLFGEIYFQSGSKIFKDDDYLDSLLNYNVKHINHAYDVFLKYNFKPKNMKYGYREKFESLTTGYSITDVVIGYKYKNIKLFKHLSEKKIKEITKDVETTKNNFNSINSKIIYVADFEYETEDIIKETAEYVELKIARLVDTKPLR